MPIDSVLTENLHTPFCEANAINVKRLGEKEAKETVHFYPKETECYTKDTLDYHNRPF